MPSPVQLQSLASGVEFVGLSNGLLTFGLGRPVVVYERGTTTQVPVFADEGLSQPLSQPLTTSAQGAIPGWIEGSQSIDFFDVRSESRAQAEALIAGDVIGSDGTIGGPGSVGLTPGAVRAISTTGHPTTGTWLTDQAVVDAAGSVWLCTAGGTPGTWVEGAVTGITPGQVAALGNGVVVATSSSGVMVAGPTVAEVTLAGTALQQLPIEAVATSSATAVVGAHNPFNATGAAVTVTLPSPTGPGELISVEKTDSSTNAVTINLDLRDTPGSTLVLQLQHETVVLESDGAGGWWPIASHKTLSSLDARYVEAAELGAANGAGTLDSTGHQPLSQAALTVQQGAALAAGTAPMPTWVLEGWTLSQDFVLLSATRNANEVITTASVLWPDGSTGSFTTDTINPTFNTIDAFHVTYVWTVNGGGNHTITQAAVTRDASGAVIAQPNPTVV